MSTCNHILKLGHISNTVSESCEREIFMPLDVFFGENLPLEDDAEHGLSIVDEEEAVMNADSLIEQGITDTVGKAKALTVGRDVQRRVR